jgi:thiosulfate/3-mercaptopyruvate sulfurtransferase
VYAHLDDDLSGPKTGTNGRHPLPDRAALARTLGRFGIGPLTQVVAYDQDAGMYASRLWWLLRWMGHEAVAVLDGGFEAWISEGRPTLSGAESRPPSTFSGSPRGDMTVEIADIERISAAGSARLIDARPPERFRGEVEPYDRVPGHIPGAVSYFHKRNVDERGRFRSREELERDLQAAIGGTPMSDVICYCGSGVTACHNLLALEHVGLRGARLYPGSFSEWATDPSRPVERS